MSKLLIVDALDLSLFGPGGRVEWSSRSCFERVFARAKGTQVEIAAADDDDLCAKAMSMDGVILGGSSASAWQDTTFNDRLLDLIAICKMSEIPFLGICYGAQLLGRALGGEVGRHPDGIELGAPAVRLTEQGRRHFLFDGAPGGCFWSVETHRDAILSLPPGCELLASTEHSIVQAFTFRDLLMGVQFHPEMSAEDLRGLWRAFQREGIVEAVSPQQGEVLRACQCDAFAGLLLSFARWAPGRRSAWRGRNLLRQGRG